jgi:hypothetical protein
MGTLTITIILRSGEKVEPTAQASTIPMATITLNKSLKAKLKQESTLLWEASYWLTLKKLYLLIISLTILNKMILTVLLEPLTMH